MRKIRIKTTLCWVEDDAVSEPFIQNQTDVDDYEFRREVSGDTVEGKLENGRVVVLLIYKPHNEV